MAITIGDVKPVLQDIFDNLLLERTPEQQKTIKTFLLTEVRHKARPYFYDDNIYPLDFSNYLSNNPVIMDFVLRGAFFLNAHYCNGNARDASQSSPMDRLARILANAISIVGNNVSADNAKNTAQVGMLSEPIKEKLNCHYDRIKRTLSQETWLVFLLLCDIHLSALITQEDLKELANDALKGPHN